MLLSVYRNTPLKFKVWVSAMTVSDLYTPNEVAIRLKVSPNTVRKWCRNFDIPSIKLGNQRRITGEVLRKIESGELMVGKVSSLSSPHIITKEKESQPPPIEEGVTPEYIIQNYKEFTVFTTLVVSVMMASSESGSLARKCRSILL